ncbi:MAG: glycosyltransferase family 8 protein [Mailhella sp.]|nr:glycosyltransferase family 8 protein [Mailhella sp.]
MHRLHDQQKIEKLHDSVTVVFALDNSFCINLAPCIQSLIEHASPEKFYDIIVLSSDLSEANERALESMTSDMQNVSLRVYDVSSLIDASNIKRLKTGKRLSNATYYRFFIPQLLSDYDKALYLDGDTIILEDISLVFNTDISDYYAAAAKDANIIRDMSRSFAQYAEHVLGLKDTSLYFNAGVMLLNLKSIRNDFNANIFFEAAVTKGIKHHDQDVLNSLFYGKILFLHPRYNVMWLNSAFYEGMPEHDKIVGDPAIIHYSGGVKPFNKNGAFKEASSYFWQYAQKTPCYGAIAEFFHKDCLKARLLNVFEKLTLLRCKAAFLLSSGRRRRHYTERITYLKNSQRYTKMVRNGILPDWIRTAS